MASAKAYQILFSNQKKNCALFTVAFSMIMLDNLDDNTSHPGDNNRSNHLKNNNLMYLYNHLNETLFSQFNNKTCKCDEKESVTSSAFPSPDKKKNISIQSLEKRLTIQGIQSFLSKSSFRNRYIVDFDSPPLGEGGFGTVYLAVDKNTGENVALKKIDKKLTDNDSFLKEMRALLHIKAYGGHPHIAALREYFEEGDYYYLILDLVSGGEMFDHLVNLGAYSEADAARILREVACALAFLHGIGIVHGDLKPENLMLSSKQTSDAVIKVVDFGCADLKIMDNYYEYLAHDFDLRDLKLLKQAQKSNPKQGEVNTPAYSPPEILRGSPNHPGTDIWALGVILYIMLTGLHPFDFSGQSTDEQIARRITEHEVPPLYNSPITAHISKSALDLISKLMLWDPKKRLTAQELLSHPWIKGETAKTDIITDSDKKLVLFRRFRSKLEAKVFSDIVSWSVAAGVDKNNDESKIRKKTSILERAFQNFDSGKKGYINSHDILSNIGEKKTVSSSVSDEEKEDSLSLSEFSNLLSENMKSVYFPKGYVIYKEGDVGNQMYFVDSGVIEVSTNLGTKQQRRGGDFFGEGALLSPKGLRSATTTCLTPVHVISVNREYFEKFIASDSTLQVDLREKDKLRKRARVKAILRLQNNLVQKYFRKGSYFFRNGEEGDELFILDEGTADIQINNKTVFSIKEGDVCGEYSVILGKPRNCDAICTSSFCKTLILKSHDFNSLVLDSSSSDIKLIREMCLRREVRKALVKKLDKSFPSIDDLKEAFDAIDLTKSGEIDVGEVKTLLRSLDPDFKEEDIDDIFRSISEKNGINFTEFQKIFGMEA